MPPQKQWDHGNTKFNTINQQYVVEYISLVKLGVGVRTGGEADFLCDVGPKHQVSTGNDSDQIISGPTDQGLVNNNI